LVSQHKHGAHLHCSRVRTLKVALVKWHARMSATCVFDAWTGKMGAFWTWLSEDFVHVLSGKIPIGLKDITQYLEKASRELDSALVVRNASMVSVAYYGVRRGAEVVAFTLADVVLLDNGSVRFKVKCQKITNSV